MASANLCVCTTCLVLAELHGQQGLVVVADPTNILPRTRHHEHRLGPEAHRAQTANKAAIVLVIWVELREGRSLLERRWPDVSHAGYVVHLTFIADPLLEGALAGLGRSEKLLGGPVAHRSAPGQAGLITRALTQGGSSPLLIRSAAQELARRMRPQAAILGRKASPSHDIFQ